MLKVIEIRIQKHLNGGYHFYTVQKVFEGLGNTADVRHKFMTMPDCAAWLKIEYPEVPVIHEVPHN